MLSIERESVPVVIRDKDMEGIRGNQITATWTRAASNESDGQGHEGGDQQ